ncbi:MAG: VOC family protein [Planctomycetes bacterium]|nr:VOC family protein [Planctomycetota bacterium]
MPTATKSKSAPKVKAVTVPVETASTCCDTAETSWTPVNGTICHVEFNVPDLEAAKKFYGDLFGWQFMPFGATEYYFQTPGNAGPCGCIMKGDAATDGKTMVYVNVSDMSAALTKARKLGATTCKTRTEIPGGHGFFAQIQAPEGNVLGIYSRN